MPDTNPRPRRIPSWRPWRSRREAALTAVVAATFALLVFVAPWERVEADGSGATFVGWAPVYEPPEVPVRPQDRQGWGIIAPLPNVRLDRSRLAIELLACGVVAAVVFRFSGGARGAGESLGPALSPPPEIDP